MRDPFLISPTYGTVITVGYVIYGSVIDRCLAAIESTEDDKQTINENQIG